MPSVACLSIAPVKALALVHPTDVHLEADGVAEDRRFYLLDEGGRLFTGSQHGPLVRIQADYDPASEWLALRFPHGDAVEGEARADGEPVETSFWGRPVKGSAVAGPWSQALSRFVGRPVRLMRAWEAGWDEFPASLVSSASLEELAQQAGVQVPVDARRFRMLIQVDGCRPHEEDTWIGRAVRVGETVLRVVEPDARCVVTTHNPDTGIKDLDTLKTIARYRGRRGGDNLDFGVYAAVERPGRIRVGDPVEPS